MSQQQPMTALTFATYTRFRELYGDAMWPNIDTQSKMKAYDPYDANIRPTDLVDAVVNTIREGKSPGFGVCTSKSYPFI